MTTKIKTTTTTATVGKAIKMKPLFRIGMFGAGTVGGGVYEMIMGSTSNSTSSKKGIGLQNNITISKICVRDMNKLRSTGIINETVTEITTDPKSILNDDSIHCIVEVMGGTDIAKTVVYESINSNKSVVTANKALIAEYLNELHNLIMNKQQQQEEEDDNYNNNNSRRRCISPVLAYEAAVCGGIPIIQTLLSCYVGDTITSIVGICNGTTNYMLSKMEMDGADYKDVLQEAQDLGYAESDPTADVEGYDVRAKIAILAKLAYGVTIPVENIPCKGISSITAVDFQYATKLNTTIKLVGAAATRSLPDDGSSSSSLTVYVSPIMVSKEHMLSSIRGAGNAVAITSTNMGLCTYTGPGAGRYPTANSIVADIVRVAKNTTSIDPFPTNTISSSSSSSENDTASTSVLTLNEDYDSGFYIRIPYKDGIGIIERTGEIAKKHGISIHSILDPIMDPNNNNANFFFSIITEECCKLSQVQNMCQELEQQQQEFITSTRGSCDKVLFMPIFEGIGSIDGSTKGEEE